MSESTEVETLPPRADPERFEPGDPPSVLPGVGPVRAALLAQLGIHSLRELLLFAPRRVQAFPARRTIASLGEGSLGLARIEGRVTRRRFSRFGRRSLLRVELDDDSGKLEVHFHNQPWLRERFAVGERIDVLARAAGAAGEAWNCQRLGTGADPLPAPGALVAEYPAVEGLSQSFLGGLCLRALDLAGAALKEPLDPASLARHDLPTLLECARGLHAPRDLAEFERAARRAGLERALSLQAHIVARREANARERAPAITVGDREERALRTRFPFAFTAGQLRIAAELRDDLARRVPMRRLLQGDVGSGKTALGLYASLLGAESGLQSAFMAPTELLAEQHYLGLRELCAEAGFEATLLCGSLSAAERRQALARIASGDARIVFGTHALFSADVRFKHLGLAVIDEQHRFGVGERQRLAGKGEHAHLLLMTATPIPRTLALTVYGDLDLSVLREKPPGRGPVVTRWVRRQHKAAALAHMHAALARGERMYWVVPRIGEAEDDLETAEESGIGAELRWRKLADSALGVHGVECVHGRMPAALRAARLDRFRSGEVRILVATTVIEVGVDVPEATVMVIEGADRLGLAQLHQLRGRVGRSPRPSACFLYGKARAAERLERLEADDDGFSIAEADLRQRGMGDLIGLRQAGLQAAGDLPGGSLERPLEIARALLIANPGLNAEYLRPQAIYDA